MNKEVSVIAPERPLKYLDSKVSDRSIKRVAAYCRVSSDSDEQLNSYEQQVEEWTKRLSENPNYKLVKIYSDAGISGTSTNHRDGFNEMLSDAREGKLDLIFVKSISRFARNTVLTISTIKELKELGVEVYFDNEHMSTFDPKNEFMFSIMSSMAQEESRHISENVKWTFDKLMKEGKVFCNCSRFLGYNKDPVTKNLIINEVEAPLIRLIFNMYDAGKSPAEIVHRLEKEKYKTGAGSFKWYTSTILGILKNEKYKGDLLLQKTITVDYLSHSRVKNKGQARQYYVKDNHDAIIDRGQWERVQRRIKTNAIRFRGANKDINKYNTRYPLSGMLICIHCGRSFKRRHWTQGYKTPKIMYQCNSYISERPRCPAKPLSENLLLNACADIINHLFIKDSKIFEKLNSIIESNLNIQDVDSKIKEKENEMSILEEQVDVLLVDRVNSVEPSVKMMFDEKYKATIEKLNQIARDIESLKKQKELNKDVIYRYQRIKEILNLKEVKPEQITKEILDAFIYRMIVVDKENVVFVINTTNTLAPEDIRDKRNEIIQRESIYTNHIEIKDPIKLLKLNYKVVIA